MTDLAKFAEKIYLYLESNRHFDNNQLSGTELIRFRKRAILEIQDVLEKPFKIHGHATILVPITLSKETLEKATKTDYLKMDWDFVRCRLESHLDSEMNNIPDCILEN